MGEDEDKPRTLEEVCEKEDFHIEVLGNYYCGLNMGEEIECVWKSKERDHNKLYPCLKHSKDGKEYSV